MWTKWCEQKCKTRTKFIYLIDNQHVFQLVSGPVLSASSACMYLQALFILIKGATPHDAAPSVFRNIWKMQIDDLTFEKFEKIDFSRQDIRWEKMKNGGDWMEAPDGASAACLTFIIWKRASICWLSATQHHFVAFIQSPRKSFHRKS